MNRHSWLVMVGIALVHASCGRSLGTIEGYPSQVDAAPAEGDDASPAQEFSDAGDEVDPDSLLVQTFSESDQDFLNPERGFYAGVNLLSGTADGLRAEGHSLAIAIVRLDDYRDRPLDEALLTGLEEGFAAVRAAGIKVILRFAYNAAQTDDAPKARILEHIDQLAPLLQANADVIAVQQAGFIGAWGEWHSSTNGLDNDTDRNDILEALLAALPPSRMVEVRTPMFKAAAFPGGPIEAAEWGSARARVGHHNDCFLASDSDYGTYADPVTEWQDYVAADSRYTSMGGETCAVNPPRTDCTSALEEMTRNHWTYLNREYNQAVVDGWIAGGCEGDIRRRLGYRLVLLEATHTATVSPGGELWLQLRLVNRGFAAPINQRPVEVVIAGDDVRLTTRLEGVDARDWAPGETTTITARLPIPGELAPGTYSIALRLPDADPSLAGDARYAIRLADEDVWDEATGDNVVSRELEIAAGQ